MRSSEECRARATECIDAADRTSDPERKLALLELAQRWLRLSEKFRTSENHNGLRGDLPLDFPSEDQGRH